MSVHYDCDRDRVTERGAALGATLSDLVRGKVKGVRRYTMVGLGFCATLRLITVVLTYKKSQRTTKIYISYKMFLINILPCSLSYIL